MTKLPDKRKGGDGSDALKKVLLAGAVVGGAALANAFIFYKTPPLASVLDGGEVRYFPTPDGDVFYKKFGDGPPLLLIHSIGAGCSSYEFRNVWKSLAEKYTVYALDLIGFGKSDKPDLVYTAETFIHLLDDFCRQVIGVGGGRGETDVIASSLSAAYVITLSQRDPSIFRRLVLVCPTGMEELEKAPGTKGGVVRTALKAPVLGTSVYNAITSRASIRSYLARNVYANPTFVSEEVVNQYHTSAHQPGGDRVLPSFIGGQLNANVREAFKGVVDLPLLVWGRQAKETPLTQAEAFLSANPHAKLEVIEDAGLLPHEEQPDAFLAAVRPFLAAADDHDPQLAELAAA